MIKDFTFDTYKDIFCNIIRNQYSIITLKDYFIGNYNKDGLNLINRIDVDFKPNRLKIFCEIFDKLNIKASVYVRLHAPDYNLFSISNIRIIQDLISIGCEIGLHTELEDVGEFCSMDKDKLLLNDLRMLESTFGIKIYGTASHGDSTPFNNLHFWTMSERRPEDFGLLYEAYDKGLWESCRYVSDSEWTRWKAYEKGVLLNNDRRTPVEHIEEDKPSLLYMLTHPDGWYDRYIYE